MCQYGNTESQPTTQTLQFHALPNPSCPTSHILVLLLVTRWEPCQGDHGTPRPFDGQVQHWQAFKANVCRLCDEKDWTWLIEGANVLSDHLQVTVATMTPLNELLV
jgi:hypothetical protein